MIYTQLFTEIKKQFTVKLAVILSFMLLTIGFGSCTDYHEQDSFDLNQEETTENIVESRYDFDKAVYNESTKTWIYPAADPYTLTNFQKAYDYVASEPEATRSLSLKEPLPKIQLQKTHYNVKIYPKTLDELNRLEAMDDIPIYYIPFDYYQVPDTVSKKWDSSQARQVFPNERRYTVTYDHESEYGSTQTEEVSLPVIYAVWPGDKPFPADMEYEILYEVFLPDTYLTTRSGSETDAEIMKIVESNAHLFAWGGEPGQIDPNLPIVTIPGSLTGTLYHYDNTVESNVPLINLQVRAQSGTKIVTSYTDSEGKFLIPAMPTSSVIDIVFCYEYCWKISYQGDPSSIITKTLGVYSDLKAQSLFYIFTLKDDSYPVYEIHRAANFYFNGDHKIPKYRDESIRIRALNFQNSSEDGYFEGFANILFWQENYISIYNNHRSNHSKLIGAVLHELGHFAQFHMKGGYNKYADTYKPFRESWASYVGWYLGELYYQNLGHIIVPVMNITNQSRQSWEWTGQDYTPLFVDLRDIRNQYIAGFGYPYDPISNVDFSILNDLATKCQDKNSFKSMLLDRLKDKYPASEIRRFWGYFDPYTILAVYPTTVTNTTPLNIELGMGLSGNVKISIHNTNGAAVINRTVNVTGGSTIQQSVNGLSSGMYTVRITHPSATANTNFTKL